VGKDDGLAASRLFLGVAGTRVASSPELERLQARKTALENRIAQLRAQRPSTSSEQEGYLADLETLLLDLARTNEEIGRLGGAPAGDAEKPAPSAARSPAAASAATPAGAAARATPGARSAATPAPGTGRP
jgi:hypothetical protein